MLQQRIERLGSGILKFKGNKVHVIGFMNPERLDDYCTKNIDCHYSDGIYPCMDLYWGKVQDNADFILLDENNNIICRHKFIVLKKDKIKYKEKGKAKSKTYYIRKCIYTDIYNFIARETKIVNGKKSSIEDNRLFNTLDTLQKFCIESFGQELITNEDIKIINN